MRRLIVWATVISGVAAAYLMYKRGESLGTIAQKTVTDPIGSFTREVSKAV